MMCLSRADDAMPTQRGDDVTGAVVEPALHGWLAVLAFVVNCHTNMIYLTL